MNRGKLPPFKLKIKMKTKKEITNLIKKLHRRFIEMDFIMYTEKPKVQTEFYTDKKTKEKYKKLIFKYKNKFTFIEIVNPLEYKFWRANFPLQAVTK